MPNNKTNNNATTAMLGGFTFVYPVSLAGDDGYFYQENVDPGEFKNEDRQVVKAVARRYRKKGYTDSYSWKIKPSRHLC